MVNQNAQIIDLITVRLSEIDRLLITIHKEASILPPMGRITKGFLKTVLNTQLNLKKLLKFESIAAQLNDPKIIDLMSNISENLATISGVISDYYFGLIVNNPKNQAEKKNSDTAIKLRQLRKKMIDTWNIIFEFIKNKKNIQIETQTKSGIRIVFS